jgi:DNA-binding CsgD family transcriptional regulator/tetratricopeptide (TPR) repeat protein
VFVGRPDELRLLQGLVDGVVAGEGAAVWVGGDPGIGKSALIAAGLAATEGRGCRVCYALAYEQSPIFPLQLLVDALGGGVKSPLVEDGSDPIMAGRAEIISLLHGGQVELVTPRDAVAMVAERIVVLVHQLCAVSPVILVLDDAQWADGASLGVLARLGKVLRQLPLLLLVAARSVPARAEVGALREVLADAGGQSIDLGPLSSAEASELVQQVVGVPPGPVLTEQLTAAGGNPLFLRELIDALVRESRLDVDVGTVELRGGSAGLPGTAPAAIGRRLSFLSQETMSALRVAATLGPVFSVADLATVTGHRATELIEVVDEAVSAGVLAESVPGMLAFRHGLVHQALYQGMPASLRGALHRQAARSLAEGGVQAERVAVQLLAAPPRADAWTIDWVAAAAPRLSHSAPRVAAELLERARDELSWDDPRRKQVDADLAMARLVLGDNEQVVGLGRPVLEGTSDPALAGRIAWILAYALPRLGRHDEAIEVAGRALARDGLPPVWSARLRARRATSLFAVGRYEAAQAEAERAEAEGTAARDRLAVGYALYTLARLDIVARRTIRAGTDAMQRALAVLGDEPQATDLVLQLMANLGVILHALGLPAEADRMFAQAATLVERGTPPRQAYLRAFSALHAFHRGRWDDALAELDGAAQLTVNATYRQYLSGIAALVAFHRDDREAVDAYLRGVANIQLPDGEIRMEVEFMLVAQALAAERDGNPAEALARLLAIFDPDATLKFPRLSVISTQWLPDAVRLALTIGKPAVAAAAADACAREAEAQAAPPWTAGARHCEGLLDHDPAAVLAAAELLQSTGYPLHSALALENAAVLLAEDGDTEAARASYLRAIGIYSDLGAAWDIMRADARMRQHNIRRGRQSARRRPTTGWPALTPTEQRIARLVAEGASNPDIASQLFLSRHTVQSHVSHILTKLNARSRVEIARAAAGQHSASSARRPA